MQITPFYSGRMAYDITADNGDKYVFVPKEFAEKGFVQDGLQWFEPEFLKAGAFEKAATFTLPDASGISDQAKALYQDPTQGYIWKAEDYAPINKDDFTMQSYPIGALPPIEGLARVKNQYNDQLVYKVPTEEGWQQTYIWGQNDNGSVKYRSVKVTPGKSLLGKVFGSAGDTLANFVNEGLGAINSLGPIPNLAIAAISPQTAAAIAAANAGQGAATGDWESAAINAGKAAILSNAGGAEADPNAVGGVTGPDNIDVGGGWSPAAGATAAELEAARLALEQPVTAEQITTNIAGDNIDAGGGWSPATGATETELAQARAAMAADSGLTFKQALDGVRAGLFVNAIAGDPLGLGGGTPSVGGGTTGFDIVPVPTEWKSPTYAPSAAPIDLESIFSNQNMLGGTQWQNLPSQNNLTFNEIFASGQQYTPMGTPVDINQIVGSILGQTTTG